MKKEFLRKLAAVLVLATVFGLFQSEIAYAEPKYDSEPLFSDGIAPVRKGDVWYIINKKGKVLHTIK